MRKPIIVKEQKTPLTTPYTPSFLNFKGSARTTGELIRYNRNASCNANKESVNQTIEPNTSTYAIRKHKIKLTPIHMSVL